MEANSIDIQLSFSHAQIRIFPVGEDLNILFSGGDLPHIGCTVIAVPRPSLTGDGSLSVTSSVISLTGYKDEAVCRLLAEEYCRKTGRTVVCTGGFHSAGAGTGKPERRLNSTTPRKKKRPHCRIATDVLLFVRNCTIKIKRI